MNQDWDAFITAIETRSGPGGSWMIEQNPHRSYYNTVSERISFFKDDDQFESMEEMKRAIDLNTMVTLHWYKEHPVSSYKLSAPDLASLKRSFFALVERLDGRDRRKIVSFHTNPNL